MGDLPPLLILALGTAWVVGMIVALRVNAFLALTTAAIPRTRMTGPPTDTR